MNLHDRFASGLEYEAFLERYGSPEHRRRWAQVHDAVTLTAAQRELLGGFKREMKALVLAGAWCGDCVNQCPIFDHFEKASPPLVVRYLDRDADADVRDALSICGGARVPTVVFFSEDGFECGRYGDRTLATYRKLAVDQLGPTCPTGIFAPEQSLLAAIAQEWLGEFERIQLMLRLSARLRQKHGD